MHPAEIEEEKHSGAKHKTHRIALLGNPNSGKTSLFNQLTGLRQKVGNFPGVTVEKKTGHLRLSDGRNVQLIDFPGTYSLHPTSADEKVVVNALCDVQSPEFPDAIIYVADITQLEQHLLFFTQLLDLGLPIVLVLNMSDQADVAGGKEIVKILERRFRLPVLALSARTGSGFTQLKTEIELLLNKGQSFFRYYRPGEVEIAAIEVVKKQIPKLEDYQALLVAHHYNWLTSVPDSDKEFLREAIPAIGFQSLNLQVRETMQRYNQFTPWIHDLSVHGGADGNKSTTSRIDRIFTNRVIGPILFALLMILVFQAIFSWASYPMDWIDGSMTSLGAWFQDIMPEAWYTNLLTEGILAGLGGVLIFIPQIAILFFLVALLEEVGYMARAVFLFDRLMQRFGLNGRSVVALISGGACAIPAVMSTRTIANRKERLITILVTPFISCSARIPVYTVLIGFVVPSVTIGIFNLQGLAFMGLYLLGIVTALGSAWVFKKVLKSDEPGFLLMELPVYRWPDMRNVFLTVYERVRSFTVEAGKIIFAISIVIWFLASYGPGTAMKEAKSEAIQLATDNNLDADATADLLAAQQLEHSYAGILGKAIEPAIQPLGFDWKMGIAIITSFAAREVFVSTMATIYSIGSQDNEGRIIERLAAEKDPLNGTPVYTTATSFSLLIFYVFAMQCMSTLAVVRRETRSWKWPLFQFLFMTGLAYISSLIIYQSFLYFA
ncbi:MAG: ferrous iron transport protein B [Saprospiraceae bacterium]|nr:ferrous iron transport protein B [Saprospiraceae bacterium]